jgi:hypothetical protein
LTVIMFTRLYVFLDQPHTSKMVEESENLQLNKTKLLSIKLVLVVIVVVVILILLIIAFL